MQRLPRRMWLWILLGGGGVASFLLPNYYLYLLSLAGVWAIAALGLNLLTGYAGQISIGHAGFVAIGAYTSALLMLRAGCPFWLALPVAGAVSASLGLALGLPALRLSGPYLAIATLGFVVAVEQVFDKWGAVTGGFQGLKAPRPAFGPLVVADDRGLYALTLILVAVMTGLAVNLVQSPIGRAWVALRDSEPAAQAVGVSLTRFKVLAFAVSAFYGGVAGSLYAHLVGFISPPDFNLAVSIFLVSVIVVGGLASIPGTLAGAAFLTLFFQRMSGLRDLRSVIYGLGLILVVIFLPGGLARISCNADGILRTAQRVSRIVSRRKPREATARDKPQAVSSLPSALRDMLTVTDFSIRPRCAPGGGPARRAGRDMLTVTDLSIAFGGLQALNQVSFRVGAGEIVGLIGPNGAGKTTVLNCLSRFYQPDNGVMRFGNVDLRAYRPHEVVRLGLGRTFQNVELFGSLSVLDNVLVGLHAVTGAGKSLTSLSPVVLAALRLGGARREEKELQRQAMDVLAFLELLDVAGWPAAALPFGVRKRVELARALVTKPKLLLLDEPAAGLNPHESAALGDLLRRIREAYSCALLLVEHDMSLVMGLCERIVVLDFGQVIAEGTPGEVQNNPAVIEAYLGVKMGASTY